MLLAMAAVNKIVKPQRATVLRKYAHMYLLSFKENQMTRGQTHHVNICRMGQISSCKTIKIAEFLMNFNNKDKLFNFHCEQWVKHTKDVNHYIFTDKYSLVLSKWMSSCQQKSRHSIAFTGLHWIPCIPNPEKAAVHNANKKKARSNALTSIMYIWQTCTQRSSPMILKH